LGQSWAVVDVGGVGYQVYTPSRTVGFLPPIGEEVKLFTSLVVREDALQLYGFLEGAERDLFERLISVNGIGPRMALALLDTLKPPELVQAILQGNTRALALAPGVGQKTAERLAIELRNQLAKWRTESGELAAAGARAPSKVYEEVEMALLALGYTPGEVAAALNAVAPQLAGQAQTQAWLRTAIAWLAEQS
jgi:Holliday junction DNA helicase RuvA